MLSGSGVSEFHNVATAKELFGDGYMNDVGVDAFINDDSIERKDTIVLVPHSNVRAFLYERIHASAREIIQQDHLDDKEMFASFVVDLVGNLKALNTRNPLYVLFQ